VVGQSEAELEATRAREIETATEVRMEDDSVRSENPGRGGVTAGSETRVVEDGVVCLEG
jgi:hypothetical protein